MESGVPTGLTGGVNPPAVRSPHPRADLGLHCSDVQAKEALAAVEDSALLQSHRAGASLFIPLPSWTPFRPGEGVKAVWYDEAPCRFKRTLKAFGDYDESEVLVSASNHASPLPPRFRGFWQSVLRQARPPMPPAPWTGGLRRRGATVPVVSKLIESAPGAL